ncbi:hypothetical protein HMPREF9120_01473 [Neisseria sp. oral taxon 020 str. F0370]|nr:hypothetical protein HMPREF9120_01473 [Neisseria sp. oral taxon 020 str. F0370]
MVCFHCRLLLSQRQPENARNSFQVAFLKRRKLFVSQYLN